MFLLISAYIKEIYNIFAQDGYKEREDRIAELEEFINDQVTELDKMEAAMKQTVANKDIAEKELNVSQYVGEYMDIAI